MNLNICNPFKNMGLVILSINISILSFSNLGNINLIKNDSKGVHSVTKD